MHGSKILRWDEGGAPNVTKIVPQKVENFPVQNAQRRTTRDLSSATTAASLSSFSAEIYVY